MLCVNLNTVCKFSFWDRYFTVFNHCLCNTEYQKLSKNEKSTIKYSQSSRTKEIFSKLQHRCTLYVGY